jgi:hypothetical protein
MMINGLEFAGGLRESADPRKYNVTPARTPENEYDPDGPLNLFSRFVTTVAGKFTGFYTIYPTFKHRQDSIYKTLYL